MNKQGQVKKEKGSSLPSLVSLKPGFYVVRLGFFQSGPSVAA
jgi:hypothetical protein